MAISECWQLFAASLLVSAAYARKYNIVWTKRFVANLKYVRVHLATGALVGSCNYSIQVYVHAVVVYRSLKSFRTVCVPFCMLFVWGLHWATVQLHEVCVGFVWGCCSVYDPFTVCLIIRIVILVLYECECKVRTLPGAVSGFRLLY